MKFVDKRYAKSDAYRELLEKIDDQNVCPFCPVHIKKFKREPVLKQSGKWSIMRVDYPYKNAEEHFVIIGERHKTNFNQLSLMDFASIRNLVNWAIAKFKIKGGGFCCRFGDTNMTGATVSHFHIHLIVPKLNKRTKRAKVVNFPIG